MRVPRSGSRQSGPQEEALEGVMKIDITILGLFLDFRVGKCERLC